MGGARLHDDRQPIFKTYREVSAPSDPVSGWNLALSQMPIRPAHVGRVAFVSCYLQWPVLMPDAHHAVLAGALRRRGHHVGIYHAYLHQDAKGEVWASTLEALRDGGPWDLVVVDRLWREGLISDIASAVGEAPIAFDRWETMAPWPQAGFRMEPMTRENLTATLEALLSGASPGDEDIPGLRVRAPGGIWSKPRTLGGFVSLTEYSAPLDFAYDVVKAFGASTDERQTLRFLMLNVGCPYRMAPNLTGFLDDVETGLSWGARGCTFCAFPRYERQTAAERRRLMRDQLQALSARGAFTALSIQDQYIFRDLDVLVEEVLAAVDHPVDLLVQARIDYFTACEPQLVRALELLGDRGRIVPYLVGFENFSDAELRRYNKGQGAEEAEAAVFRLESLVKAYPNLAHRKSHGFILFGPWTTMTDLELNLSAVVRTGFDAYRGHLTRTKLRLTPGNALWARAQADGLLVDGYERSDEDSAADVGYEAEAPYRFMHPEVARVWERLNGPAPIGGGTQTERLREALALTRAEFKESALARSPHPVDVALGEHAERFTGEWGDEPVRTHMESFFRRWPGLSASPRLVGKLTRRVGPPFFDPEFEAVAGGLRAGGFWEPVPVQDAPWLLDFLGKVGLWAAQVSERLVPPMEYGRIGHKHVRVTGIVFARDEETLAQMLQAQRAVEEGGGADRRAGVRRMGAFLAYPPCCVEAFMRDAEGRDNHSLMRFPFQRRPEAVFRPRLNTLRPDVHLISHVPCTPDCEPSWEVASGILKSMGDADAAIAEAVEGRLTRPMLWLQLNGVVDLEGDFEDGVVHVRGASARGTAFHFVSRAEVQRLRRVEVWPTHVTLAYHSGRERVLPVQGSFIAIPGSPLSKRSRKCVEVAANHSGYSLEGEPAERVTERERAVTLLIGQLPRKLSGGWSLTSARPRPHRPVVDLELEHASKVRVSAYLQPATVDKPAFLKTRQLGVSYYGVHPETADATPGIEVLRDFLGTRETAVKPTQVQACFDPSSDEG